MSSHETPDAAPDETGCEEFDRARALLADGRDEDALDWFEVASTAATEPAVRASAAAHAAGILLSRGRPWEVDAWADLMRVNAPSKDLADLLEASARLQLDDPARALALLEHVAEPADPWFPCSVTSARVVRAHARYLDGDPDGAREEVLTAFANDPFAPDVWDAFARLCAETDFDPQPVVDLVPDERALDVLVALRTSEAVGVDRIAEMLWARNTSDARVLAIVPSFASRLDSLRAMHWSARLRAAGMGRTCPLLDRADNDRVDAPERVRSAALAHASFGDRRARDLLEKAVPILTDAELVSTLVEVWTLAPAMTDSVVVAAATTPHRSLMIAATLWEGGATTESYSVLLHGLGMDTAEELTTEDVIRLLPLPALEGLALEAETRGEDDVAGILEAVAVVSADASR